MFSKWLIKCQAINNKKRKSKCSERLPVVEKNLESVENLGTSFIDYYILACLVKVTDFSNTHKFNTHSTEKQIFLRIN